MSPPKKPEGGDLFVHLGERLIARAQQQPITITYGRRFPCLRPSWNTDPRTERAISNNLAAITNMRTL